MVHSYAVLSVLMMIVATLLYLYNLNRLSFDRLGKTPGSVKTLAELIIILLIILGLLLINTPVRSKLDTFFDSEYIAVVANGIKQSPVD